MSNKMEEEEPDILTHSHCFKWSSCLETKAEDRDQEIWIIQSEEGYEPATRDIFDLTTRPKHGDESEDETISFYFKDIPRIIALLQQITKAAEDGYCNVNVHELDEDEKKDLT